MLPAPLGHWLPTTFQCETLDDPDDTTFLLIDKSVDCKTPFHQTMQIYAGVIGCFFVFVFVILAAPYRYWICNHAQVASLLQLFILADTAPSFSIPQKLINRGLIAAESS